MSLTLKYCVGWIRSMEQVSISSRFNNSTSGVSDVISKGTPSIKKKIFFKIKK